MTTMHATTVVCTESEILLRCFVLQGTQNIGVLGGETGPVENDRVSSGCMSCKLYILMLALYLNKHPRV